MEKLRFRFETARTAGGTSSQAIVGVVASGNLEVLAERSLPPSQCLVDVATPIHGFDVVWRAVTADFVARCNAGGLRISINDGGARPDTVALRLAQVVRSIEEPKT